MNTHEAKTVKKASKKTSKPAARVTRSKQTVKPTKLAKAARPDSKKEIVLNLLRREQGATLAEIAKATAWQNHSIRGFVTQAANRRLFFIGLGADTSGYGRNTEIGDKEFAVCWEAENLGHLMTHGPTDKYRQSSPSLVSCPGPDH